MAMVLDRKPRALIVAPPFCLFVSGRLSFLSGGLLSIVHRGLLFIGVSTRGGTHDGSATSLSIEQMSELESSCALEDTLVASCSCGPSQGQLSFGSIASSSF